MAKERVHFTISEKTRIIAREMVWIDNHQTKQIAEQIARATDSLVFSDLNALVKALKVIAKGKES